MLRGQLLSPALLVGQEFLETGRGEGESLSAEPHQVGVLEPGVIEAVFDGGPGPVGKHFQEIFRSKMGRIHACGLVNDCLHLSTLFNNLHVNHAC